MNKVVAWTAGDVLEWLCKEGMQEYIDALDEMDGPALLRLTKADFEKPPLSRVSSDGGQQLLERLATLKIKTEMGARKNGQTNGHVGGISNGTSKSFGNGTLKEFQDMIQIPIPTVETTRSPFPTEWGKTGIAFLYALVCFVTTTVVISVVHERVPPKEHTPPLPDKFFDWFDRIEWAFSICEINGMLLVGLWLIQWILLKHRSIIGRRFFFIVGTLYLYRCITMYITTLPVPGMHFKCAPKVELDEVVNTWNSHKIRPRSSGGATPGWPVMMYSFPELHSAEDRLKPIYMEELTVWKSALQKLLGNWEAQMRRVMKMIAGGGLSITGAHTMCGDYLYSGHTVMLTLTYLFIKEYSPKRFWWYHWLCWGLSAVGIFCILLAHDHYTVDVVVAYFITTRLFWWYHTMANQQSLKETSQSNPFSRVWWYRLFQYFEENVNGTVPRNYQRPFSWRALQWNHSVKYSRLDIQ